MSFKAKITLFQENGRRHPIKSGYRPHFNFEDKLLTDGVIKFDYLEIGLGQIAEVEIRLLREIIDPTPGLTFRFFEGPKAVGSGVII